MADDAQSALASYLNDHHAGAKAAVGLLGHLASAYAGTEMATFAESLRAEVTKDQATLVALMAELGVGQSPIRAAVGWAAEKLARVKLMVDDPSLHGGLHLFEALEGLSLGIEGKRLLWTSLAALAERLPTLAGRDYDALIGRANAQRAEVERRRLDAARALIAPAM